jgi:hypothetical protein
MRRGLMKLSDVGLQAVVQARELPLERLFAGCLLPEAMLVVASK